MLSKTEWAGWPSWQLENDTVRVVVIPELGAKIVSLFDKQAEREWLVKPRRPLKAAPYGAPFVDYDLSGWDEMFPTILACDYPAPGAYQGKTLPDHGEVWALPWTIESIEETALILSIQGQALPYLLKRKARLLSSGTLRLDYELLNQGGEPLTYLWAAHPLFAVDQDTRIILPPEVTELYNVSALPPWGKEGVRYTWPIAEDETGRKWNHYQVGPASNNDCRKFYIPPETTIDWVKLKQENAGNWLRLTWSSEQIPYVGLWIDEGAYSTEAVAAPEPASGFYDSLATAWNRQQISVLEPGGIHNWSVKVQIGLGE